MRGAIRQKCYDTASDPSLGRRRRTLSAWMGLVLLLFNVVAGGALPAQAAVPSLSDDHLIVCTAGGMAVIDRNGTPVSPDHAGENGFCGACLPFSHGAVLTPLAVPLPVPFVQPLPRAPLADAEPARVARPLRLAFPRAPPAA
ncbi:MAG: DUF2946 family protein [Magnetospirillum sp.]|nr:DUF2946 family protein [Magnetospirillum sp.]